MEKAYIVQLETGEKLGPYDEEALKRLAREGQIPEDAQIRSTMLAVWEKAKNLDCLKPIFREKMLERAEAFANDPKARLRARLEMRGDYDPLASALSQEGITYHNCSLFSRFLAALFDMLVLGAVAFGILFCYWMLMRMNVLSSMVALYLFVFTTWIVASLYFMYFLSEWGQTLGQRFWGLVVITPNRTKIYPIKAFIFFLLCTFFGILSPFTWLIFGCRYTLQERIPKVLVRHITVTRRFS